MSHTPCATTTDTATDATTDTATDTDTDTTHPTGDLGQATTEYALVMLGAAAIALLVIAWATAGGGAGRIGQLFDQVIDAVVGQI